MFSFSVSHFLQIEGGFLIYINSIELIIHNIGDNRQMDIRTWHFVLDVVSKCRDWIEEWMEVCPLKYELVPFDVHKDENLDYVCMVRVESTKEELSNLMFRGVNTIDGVKITALQSFGED